MALEQKKRKGNKSKAVREKANEKWRNRIAMKKAAAKTEKLKKAAEISSNIKNVRISFLMKEKQQGLILSKLRIKLRNRCCRFSCIKLERKA